MVATFGKHFAVTVVGESHGQGIGVVIDGCPAGLALSEADVQPELEKRRPGQSALTTQRREADRCRILTGVFNAKTTGRPITMWIDNADKVSAFYEETRDTPRPGHADYPSMVKWGGFDDYRGGGAFSARLTACFVMAGAVAKKLLRLKGVECLAHVTQIGGITAREGVSDEAIRKNVYSSPVRCADAGAANKMQEAIEGARREGDSVGGVIEARINGLPAGLGEPLFDSFESVLAHWVFSIPATKGVEFGSGFAGSGRLGSQNSDAFYFGKDGLLATKSNNNGGILGGLTSGMPVVMRVAFKPASSINKPQLTANLVSKKQVELKVKGRHDPCVAIRAVPIIEAVCAIASAEFLLASGGLPKVLK